MNSVWQIFNQELEDPQTTHQRRLQIGQACAEMGDPRQGVGVRNGVPEIEWLPVAPGGRVEILRVWTAESPDQQDRVLSRRMYTVEPFYIAKYSVTSVQFQAFVDAEDGFNQMTWWEGMAEEYQRQQLRQCQWSLPNSPRNSLSWYQSMAFARWVNHKLSGLELPCLPDAVPLVVGQNAQVRLPTESEWQWAAQNGKEARTYPWGDSQNGNVANTVESLLAGPVAVGMYPRGAAACGALDMTGNLMEWCATNKADPELIDVGSLASKVLRGGDWGYELKYATCTYCDDDEPGRIDPLNGCRLVLSILPSKSNGAKTK